MDYRPLASKLDVIVQVARNETLLYNLKNNQALCLNETSATIWNLCDGRLSVLEISVEMSKQMRTSISEDFVWLAISELNEKGLLEEGFELSDRFIGLTRRDVIRKIGFASLVSLPVISSVIAPRAIAAQSCGMALATCTTGSCCTGLTCNPTNDKMFGSVPVSTGVDQCCAAGSGAFFTPSSQFCDTGACGGANCCSGISVSTTGHPDCGAVLTCVCA